MIFFSFSFSCKERKKIKVHRINDRVTYSEESTNDSQLEGAVRVLSGVYWHGIAWNYSLISTFGNKLPAFDSFIEGSGEMRKSGLKVNLQL